MIRRRSGVALVVVLWTVALLATVTALASSAARTSAQVASNERALATARAMGESGIIAAMSMVSDSLAALRTDSARSEAFLGRLEQLGARGPLLQDTLSEGVFAVTIIDVSARLDVNSAGADGLAALLRTVTDDNEARRLAELVDARVRGVSVLGGAASTREAEAKTERDSLGNALLGRTTQVGVRHPFQSLDELLEIEGFDQRILMAIAPLLTVDGDGRVNRRAAPPLVLAAATGSLVDRPARLLFVSRGWQRGHPLTREIQAVYDVADDGLRFVRWREVSR